MNRRRVVIVSLVAAGASVAGAGGIAVAAGGDDGEAPITGAALERATAAALAHTGGGRVTETEVGDEDSYYEVEVTLDDGTQVDVQLDQGFTVVSSEGDDDSSEDDAGDGADD
ncbi:MAG: PepSY domain-containing protein [Acidimicrobiales bacterium]